MEEPPFLNTRNNKSYFLHQKKKKGTSMRNVWVIWVFVLVNASNFVKETGDNSIKMQIYDTCII